MLDREILFFLFWFQSSVTTNHYIQTSMMLGARITRRFASSTSASKSRPFPFVKATFVTLTLGAGLYTGAAVVALNNDSAKKVWVENVPGGEDSLRTVDDGLQRIQSLTMKDVEEGIKKGQETVEQTMSQVKVASEKSYQTASETINTVQQSLNTNIANAQQLYKTTAEQVSATYDEGSKILQKTKETASEYANKAFESVETIRETVFGKAPKEDPPPLPSNQSPSPASKVALATTKPVSDPIAGSVTNKSTPPPSKVEETAAKKSPKEETEKSEPTTEAAPTPATPDTSTTPLPQDESFLSMEEHKSPTGSETPASQSPKAVKDSEPQQMNDNKKGSKQKTSKRAPDLSYVAEVDSLLAKYDGKPETAEVAKLLHEVAVSLVEVSGRSRDQEKLATTKKHLLNAVKILQLSDSEVKNFDAHLKEQAESFSEILREHVERANLDLMTQAEELQQKYQTDMNEKLSEVTNQYEDELRTERQQRANELQTALEVQLKRQAEELERHWSKQISTMIDDERSNRLARVDHLAMKLKVLERIGLDAGEFSSSSLNLHQQKVALEALQTTLQNLDRRPFVSELNALKAASQKDLLVEATLNTIPDSAAYAGVATVKELAQNLQTLSQDIRRVQLMPEEGAGPVSYVVSYMLSTLVMRKKGLVPGEDIESIMARSEYFISNGDVDSAAREINQLKGWPKKLSKDWLDSARTHLEVKQAIEVRTARLSVMIFSNAALYRSWTLI
jgi:mitofilin